MKKNKGCFNPNCSIFKTRKKLDEDFKYCPLCTSELSYVCADKHCYTLLENPLQIYCDSCLQIRAEKTANRKKTAAKAAGYVSIPVTYVAKKVFDGVSDKMLKDIKPADFVKKIKK